MTKPTMDDFDPVARALLAQLDQHSIHLLAIEASQEAEAIKAKNWPSDPVAAVEEARRVMACPLSLEVDSPISDVLADLNILLLALHAKDDWQEQDCEAAQSILYRNLNLLRHAKAREAEGAERLRQIVLARKGGR